MESRTINEILHDQKKPSRYELLKLHSERKRAEKYLELIDKAIARAERREN